MHHEVLENGLTLLLRETHHAPVATLQIWAGVGSADERDGESGLAHFHEHMLFKGTERRGVGEVAGEVEGAGGRINAYTSFDATVYYATLPSPALSTGVDVLIDAVRHSTFEPGEIAREAEVVLEEIRRAQDAPGHVLSDAVFAEAYRVHPYHAPILGTSESVSGFDRERVRRFFERWYTPDNLTVIAVGDFDARELAGEIGAAFADALPGGTRRARPSEPAHGGLRTAILHRAFERVRVDISWPSASFSERDATYLELLSFALGECESSRLVRHLRERDGLVDRIDSSSYTPLDPGLFSVSLECDATRLESAVEGALAEVERLRLEPVSSDELERARANFLATEQFERESVSGLASKLGNFQVLGGDWRLEESYFETLRSATPDDLLRVAREYLKPDDLTVGTLLPESEAPDFDEKAIARCAERGRAQAARAAGPEPAPPGPARAPRSSMAAPVRTKGSGDAIVSYRLANGASLHVVPRRDVPVVAARAAFLGGLLAEDAAAAGLTHFTTAMWLRGTQTHKTADYARAVESLAAEIDGFSGRNSLGVTLEATSDKLAQSLDLFAELLLEPAFDTDELERERRETLAAIERRGDQLAQQVFLLFSSAHYGPHPYGLPMIGTRESVEGFSQASVRAQHERLIQADNLTLAVAGDVDPDVVARELSLRLADLPTGGFEPLRPAAPPPLAGIESVELHKDRAQAHLVLGFRGLTIDDDDRTALEVLAQLLAGQGGRLFLELRDRQSLAYSVSAVNVEGVSPGFFAIYIATAPEKVELARTGILQQLEQLISEPASNDELARAKCYLTGNFVIDQQRNASVAAHVALDALYGLGPDAYMRYVERVSAITVDDLLHVARRVITLDAYTLARVYPGPS